MSWFSRIIVAIFAPSALAQEQELIALHSKYEEQIAANARLVEENSRLTQRLDAAQDRMIERLETIADNESMWARGRKVFGQQPDFVPGPAAEEQTVPTRRGLQAKAQALANKAALDQLEAARDFYANGKANGVQSTA